MPVSIQNIPASEALADSHSKIVGNFNALKDAVDPLLLAPPNHTHVADNISNASAAGKALLTAADAAAQKAALSLVKADVGLGNADNTSDAGKPVSTAQAAAIAAVQNALDSHEADNVNPHAVTKAQVGLGNADNTSDASKPVSTAQATAIAAVQTNLTNHANDNANPHAVTKAQVGLGNADNTSDANKPVSNAQQAALDAKADWNATYRVINGSATLELADAKRSVKSTAAGAHNLTIPPNADVALPVACRIPVLVTGAGQMTIVAGAGVTLNSRGGVFKSGGQYAQMMLEQEAANSWVLTGDITS